MNAPRRQGSPGSPGTGLVWTSGSASLVPIQDAVVPFASPGVLFGETLFETLRAREGKLFRPQDHLQRLHASIVALRWGTPLASEQVMEGLRAVLRAEGPSAQDDLRVRITVLRLDDAGGLQYFIHATAYEPLARVLYKTGVDAVTTTVRVTPAPWLNLKTGQRLPYRLAGAEADAAGAWDGLVLNKDGMLVESSIANVHFVLGGGLAAPSQRCGALPGITQRVVQEIAGQLDIPWAYGCYRPNVVQRAAEAFLTNSLIGVLPLVRVDGAPIGSGEPGPVTRRLMSAYNQRVADESQPIT